MQNTIYSAIDDHIRLGLDAICKSCPARQEPDSIELCLSCTLSDHGFGEDDYHRQHMDTPRDTQDYFVG